jgi:hypothetical protein
VSFILVDGKEVRGRSCIVEGEDAAEGMTTTADDVGVLDKPDDC